MMTDSQGLLSIVIPTFRCAPLLPGLLDSLARQTDRSFEVVVSDGLSGDGTAEVAQRYADRLPSLKVLSRKDRGIYDAINLGIQAASGTWVLVMGADDRLASDDVIAKVRPVLERTTAEFVYGDVRVIGKNAMVADGAIYGGRFDFARLLGQNICQQAAFYRRSLVERLGYFDLRYALWADWLFSWKAFCSARTEWISLVVSHYNGGGASGVQGDSQFKKDYWRNLAELIWRYPRRVERLIGVAKFLYWRWRG